MGSGEGEGMGLVMVVPSFLNGDRNRKKLLTYGVKRRPSDFCVCTKKINTKDEKHFHLLISLLEIFLLRLTSTI